MMRRFLPTALLLALAPAAAAMAETAAAADGAAPDAPSSEAPLSNGAQMARLLSADRLQQADVHDLGALQRLVPSLLVSSAASEADGTTFSLDGLGAMGGAPGFGPAVAVYIDGIYRPYSGLGMGELGPLDRIDVLSGPEGSQFGASAAAGVIDIHTKAPEFQSLGNSEWTLGNHGNRRLALGLTGPLAGQRLAYRLDGAVERRDGLLLDLASGQRVNNRKRWMLRGQLLFVPSDRLRIRLIGDLAKRNEACCASVYQPFDAARSTADSNLAPAPGGLLAALLAEAGQPLTGYPGRRETRLTPGEGVRSRVIDRGLSAEIDWALGPVQLISRTAARQWKVDGAADADFTGLDLLRQPNRDRRVRRLSEELRLQGTAAAGRLQWMLGGSAASERLQTSTDLRFGADYPRYADCLIADHLADDADLLGHAGLLSIGAPGCLDGGRAAAFAADPGTPPALAALTGLWSGSEFPGLSGYDAAAAAVGLPGTSLAGAGIGADRARLNSRSLSLFTHNAIELRPGLQLLVGGRYRADKRTLLFSFAGRNPLCTALAASSPATGLADAVAPACVISPLSLAGRMAQNEQQWAGLVGLSWAPAPWLLLFANHRLDGQAGGFAIDRAVIDWRAPDAARMAFAPEKIARSEAGIRLAGAAASLSLAAFHSQTGNARVGIFDGPVAIVTNIQSCRDDPGGADPNMKGGDSASGACAADRLRDGVTSTGVDAAVSLRPAADLAFDAGLVLARSRYRGNLVQAGGQPLPAVLRALPGQALANAPGLVHTAALHWTPRLGRSFGGIVHVDYRLQSGYRTGSGLAAEQDQPALLVANASLGLSGPGGAWTLQLWATNLFNTYARQAVVAAPLPGSSSPLPVLADGTPATALFGAYPAAPRMLGVTARSNF